MDSKKFRTDPSVGHSVLAAAGYKYCSQFELGEVPFCASVSNSKGSLTNAAVADDDVRTGGKLHTALQPAGHQPPLNRYALRHTLAHLCLALKGQHQPATELLEKHLLNIGLWQVSGGRLSI